MAGERLLLVDDEDILRSVLATALRDTGFDVESVGSGSAALAAASARPPDLVVLDVGMRDLDGFEVCRRLRREGSTAPVLFLTDGTGDTVRGLTLGADDSLVKPFSLDELVARVQAVLRRAGRVSDDDLLSCADLALEVDAHRVTRGGVTIPLSPTEFTLLRYLLRNQARVVSRAEILDHVWSYDFGGDGGVVETYIGYLRRKLDARGPRLIRTVRGAGYVLRAG